MIVSVATEVVVYADDEEAAFDLAGAALREEMYNYREWDLYATPLKHIPCGWSPDCIAWGDDDNIPIGERIKQMEEL